MVITTETQVEIDDGKDSDTRSVSSMDISDNVSIALAAMRREKLGVTDRARRTVFETMHSRSDVIVLPEVGFRPSDSNEKLNLDHKVGSHAV